MKSIGLCPRRFESRSTHTDVTDVTDITYVTEVKDFTILN